MSIGKLTEISALLTKTAGEYKTRNKEEFSMLSYV
jgi:hypothetical protein